MTKIQDLFLYREAKKELGATFKCPENTSDNKKKTRQTKKTKKHGVHL